MQSVYDMQQKKTRKGNLIKGDTSVLAKSKG